MDDTLPQGTMVEFSESDILRNKIVEPGWYLIRIDNCNPWTPSKDQKSSNLIYDATILKNVDTDTTDYAGVPVQIMFNSKPGARGFIESFLRTALGVDVEPSRYDMGNAVGREIVAMVENETYEGRTRNRINHKYRRPGISRATVE